MAAPSKAGKSGKLIGTFIRQKREILGLSQKELGQKLMPPVTTQFISNMERGVTPLPATHIPALASALGVPESEITQVLEKEFLLKLANKSRPSPDKNGDPMLEPDGPVPEKLALLVRESHHEFMVRLAEALPGATLPQLDALATVCEQQFKIPARVLLRSLFEKS